MIIDTPTKKESSFNSFRMFPLFTGIWEPPLVNKRWPSLLGGRGNQ